MSLNVVEAQDVRSFFQESLTNALDYRNMDVAQDTVAYLVNLLSRFIRTDRFYEWSPDGYTLSPLALLYYDALQASSEKQRRHSLQRLGDIALFVTGVFAESLSRKVIDVDYYVAMGGAAYGSLSDSIEDGNSSGLGTKIFDELSRRFRDFAQVLADTCEQSELGDDQDVLRCYEQWLRTGSLVAREKLRNAGILVSTSPSNVRH